MGQRLLDYFLIGKCLLGFAKERWLVPLAPVLMFFGWEFGGWVLILAVAWQARVISGYKQYKNDLLTNHRSIKYGKETNSAEAVKAFLESQEYERAKRHRKTSMYP